MPSRRRSDTGPVQGPQLRVARADESAWCYTLHESAMRTHVEARWGWDEQLQHTLHNNWFASATVQIIEVAGAAVGVADIRTFDDRIYLSRIEMLPVAQGTGTGSAIIRQLQARGLPVRLHVFATNVGARALYERLGFVATDEDTGRIAMEWRRA